MTDMSLDSPEVLAKHGQVLRSKPLLLDFYRTVYEYFRTVSAPTLDGRSVELGAGTGFL